jgi:hypothetical protein
MKRLPGETETSISNFKDQQGAQQGVAADSPTMAPSYGLPEFTTINDEARLPVDQEWFEEDVMPEDKDDPLFKEKWQVLLTLATEIFRLTRELHNLIEERFNLTEAPASAMTDWLSRLAYLDTIANVYVAYTGNCLQLSENIRKIYAGRGSNPEIVLRLVESRFELVMERFALNLEYRAFVQERLVPEHHAARAADNQMEITEASINIFLCIEEFLRRHPWLNGHVQEAVDGNRLGGFFGPTFDRFPSNMVLTGRS